MSYLAKAEELATGAAGAAHAKTTLKLTRRCIYVRAPLLGEHIAEPLAAKVVTMARPHFGPVGPQRSVTT